MQNTLWFSKDKTCHFETRACERPTAVSPANRLWWALKLGMQLLGMYQGTTALQAASSVGEVILIRKNWEVDFAIRHQALLHMAFHKREI